MDCFTAEAVMSALAANLHRYRRPPGDQFLTYANAWIRREVRRRRMLNEIQTEHFKLLYAAFERGLYLSPAKDDAVEPCDHEQGLYLHLLTHPKKLDRMVAAKRAKPTTMLYALARSRTQGFRTFINDRSTKVGSAQRDGYNFLQFDYHSQDAASEVIRLAVLQAMSKLQPSERRTLKLMFYKGLTVSQIANRTKKSTDTVQRNLSRGLELLRDALYDPTIDAPASERE